MPIVPTAQESLKPWEKAFLGDEPLVTTSVFWQCTIGVIFALTQIYLTATFLHSRNPKLYSRWWPVFPFATVAILLLSWNFLAKAAKMKLFLRENRDKPDYNDNLLSAKSLAVNFFTITMLLGLAMIILRLFIRP